MVGKVARLSELHIQWRHKEGRVRKSKMMETRLSEAGQQFILLQNSVRKLPWWQGQIPYVEEQAHVQESIKCSHLYFISKTSHPGKQSLGDEVCITGRPMKSAWWPQPFCVCRNSKRLGSACPTDAPVVLPWGLCPSAASFTLMHEHAESCSWCGCFFSDLAESWRAPRTVSKPQRKVFDTD